ncbi:MAG: nucleotidyltransferase family protein [Prevotellaceae bacterium]|jgi:hypothetical protein|nr:nucleotidyltransferase family protein [Prevotellaceae bacterium]
MTKYLEILFSLLRIALWHRSSDVARFENIDEQTWDKVMRTASQHQVFALAFDGAMLLPDSLKPPRMLRLAWAAQVDKIEKQYACKAEIAQEIETLLAANNIKMLLFKGFTLAKCYPTPAHRQFGDLDIYCFGKLKQANRLLTEQGAHKSYDSYKHKCVVYKKVLIENHKFFLNTHDSWKIKASDKALKKIIANDKDFEKWSDFPVDFQALFYIWHTIHHFSWEAFSVRLITDMAVFWKTNIEKINIDFYLKTLQSVGLLKQANAITALVVRFLDIDKKDTPPFETDEEFEDKILAHMFSHYVLPPKNAKLNFGEVLKIKWERFFHRAKSYELIYPKENYRRFISSTVSNLKNRSFFRR